MDTVELNIFQLLASDYSIKIPFNIRRDSELQQRLTLAQRAIFTARDAITLQAALNHLCARINQLSK